MRDEVRGLYLDWEATAPGPLCSDPDELCEAVGRAGRWMFAVCVDSSLHYAALDDSGATERVVTDLA